MATQPISLEQLRVSTPCTADWSAMAGDEAARFCTHCQKHVHRIAAMRHSDAEKLVCTSAGELCAILEFAPTGEVLTLDYAPAERLSRWRRWTPIALIAAAAATSLTALGMSRVRLVPPPPVPAAVAGRMTMGDIDLRPGNAPIGKLAAGPAATQPGSTQPADAPTATPSTAPSNPDAIR